MIRRRRVVAAAAVVALSLAQGCGSSSPAPTPTRIPTVTKILVPPDFTTEDAVAVPAAISADGQAVAGTIFIRRDGIFMPTAAFRWTAALGVQLIQVPGYLSSMAVAISADGSVVTGNAADADTGPDPVGWTWTAATGPRVIPVPDGVDNYLALAATPDGAIVVGSYEDTQGGYREIFVWTAGRGFTPLSAGMPGVQVLPTAISDDGLRIAFTCENLPDFDPMCGPQGTWLILSGSRDWDPSYLMPVPASIAQEDQGFIASDLRSGEFGFFSAHSSDLTVIGGYSIQPNTTMDIPALWLAVIGQVNVLGGGDWNGYGSAVSPDGSLAGFVRHYALGDPWGFVWSARTGENDLRVLFQVADATLGSTLLDTFGPEGQGIAGPIMGFSADNARAAGVVFCYECDASEMFGYVIDAFDLVIR